MKKILILNTVYSGGGAAKVARQVFEFLNKGEEFDACFACGREAKRDDKKVFNFGLFWEKYLHIFLVRFLGVEGFGSYFATRRLINFIKKEKFDLIHIHNLHGYYLNFFTLINFLGKSKIPTVWTLHDEWPVTWMPAHSMNCLHCKGFGGRCINCYTYPKTYNNLFLKFMLNKKKEFFSTKWNPIITCPAGWLKREIESSFLKENDIRLISNGVDINVFKPSDKKEELRRKYGISLDKKIILFSISNIKDVNKGYSYIVEIAERLIDQDFIFLGVGCSNIERARNMKSIGFVSDDQKLAEIYNLADVFLYTSLIETMPLTVIEAMACGLPIIAFNINGVRDLVGIDNGFLIGPNNIPKAVLNFKLLLGSEDLRKKMSISSRSRVVNCLSLDNSLSEYREVYKNLLKI